MQVFFCVPLIKRFSQTIHHSQQRLPFILTWINGNPTAVIQKEQPSPDRLLLSEDEDEQAGSVHALRGLGKQLTGSPDDEGSAASASKRLILDNRLIG